MFCTTQFLVESRDSSKRREKVPKWFLVFALGPSGVRVRPRSARPSARPSVQNLSARNFRLNNAMVACSTALNLHLSSSHALKGESVCV